MHQRFRRDRTGMFCAGVVIFYFVIALLAPLAANAQNYDSRRTMTTGFNLG